MTMLSYSKDFQGFVDIVLNNPERYLPLVNLLDTLVCQESELTQAERELIGAYVSVLNGCDFCFGVHEAVAKSLNVDASVLQALQTDPDPDTVPVRDAFKPILDFTRKLTLTPSRIGAEDIQCILDAGWSEQTVEDTIAVASLFALLNRLVDGFGIKGSPDYFAAIGNSFTEQGYNDLVYSLLEDRRKNREQVTAS